MPKKKSKLKKVKKAVAKNRRRAVAAGSRGKKKITAKKRSKVGKSKKTLSVKSRRARALKPKKSSQSRAPKPVGKVTHFYNQIGVAIVKFNKNIPLGTELAFRGGEADFKQEVKSMQHNHEPIKLAKKGKQIGIKVKKRVHTGVLVYLSR